MSADLIAFVLGLISIAVYLVYYIWKRHFRKTERNWFSEQYKDGGPET